MMTEKSIGCDDFANHRLPDPPAPESESAAPAGPRNGAQFDRKATKLPDTSYKALARLDAIALSVEPDAEGRLPSSVLLAIGLADAIEPDADLEPSLGWNGFGLNANAGCCLDLEPNGDELDESHDGCEPDEDDEGVAEFRLHLYGGGADERMEQAIALAEGKERAHVFYLNGGAQ